MTSTAQKSAVSLTLTANQTKLNFLQLSALQVERRTLLTTILQPLTFHEKQKPRLQPKAG